MLEMSTDLDRRIGQAPKNRMDGQVSCVFAKLGLPHLGQQRKSAFRAQGKKVPRSTSACMYLEHEECAPSAQSLHGRSAPVESGSLTHKAGAQNHG